LVEPINGITAGINFGGALDTFFASFKHKATPLTGNELFKMQENYREMVMQQLGDMERVR